MRPGLRTSAVLSPALLAVLSTALAAATPAFAMGQADHTIQDLQNLSIEELARLEVTSVAKRPQALSDAAAAIYVITADDIRRSGATSLPEVLRLAPNLEVAQLNAYSYAITARGMNSIEASNKLLVLVDGRSVYEPIASGVLWQQVDVALADVERIEVISGPGGVQWGANAVNGVINIISKSARDTAGGLVEAAGGDREADATLRYGGALGKLGDFRVTLTGFDRGSLPRYSGDNTEDGFRGGRAGFALESGTPEAGFSVAAAIYDNHVVTISDALDDAGGGEFWGGNLQGRWALRLGNGSDVSVAAYFARDDRTSPSTKERRDTYNVDAQQSLRWGAHQFVWGGEARLWREDFASSTIEFFAKPKTDISLFALFGQDEWAIRPGVNLSLGLKLENNNYSGLDWMPSVRLAWTPRSDQMVWGAVSRAVRTPNRTERELESAGLLKPSPNFSSETLWAYELGWRAQPTRRISWSAQAYYNRYDDLRVDAFSTDGPSPFPLTVRNGAKGETYGIEAWGAYSVAPWWRLKAGFNTLHKSFELKPGYTDFSALQVAGTDPRYQAQLRSQMSLGPQWDLDLALRRVGEVTRTGVGVVVVPAYTEADARLAWRMSPRLELALKGSNLLNDHHLELDDRSTAPRRAIPRSVLASLRWAF